MKHLLTILALLFFAGATIAQAQATIATDKPDYPPGDTVIVTGSGWQAGETVSLTFVESPLVHPAELLSAVADVDGNIYDNAYIIQDHDLGQSFALTATGQTSGLTAETWFTDGLAFSATITPTSVNTSTSSSYTVTIRNNSTASEVLGSGRVHIPSGYSSYPSGGTSLSYTGPSGKSFDVRIGSGANSDKILYSGATTTDVLAVGQSLIISVTATSPSTAGSYVWTSVAFTGRNFSSGPYPAPSPQPTVTVTTPKSSTSLSVATASGTFGGTTSLSATLTSGVSGVSGKTINFKLNGSPAGSQTTDVSGIATLTGVSLSGINAGPPYAAGVEASFAEDGSYFGSSGSASLTVNKANATVTVTGYSGTYDAAAHTERAGRLWVWQAIHQQPAAV